MKLSFNIQSANAATLTIQREEGDKPAKASGFTRGIHGWGAEIHLLGMMQKRLEPLGFNLTRSGVQRDAHMMGDEHMQYLRPRRKDLRKTGNDFPCIYIFDGGYAVRSSAEDYNDGKPVTFQVSLNVFDEESGFDQSNCWNIIQDICERNNIECKIDKWLLPATYEVVDVLVNYHSEPELWTVGAYGRTDVDCEDDPVQIGDTEDYADEKEGKAGAIESAVNLAEMFVSFTHQAQRVVILVEGNEYAVYDLEFNSEGRPVARNAEHQLITAGELMEGDRVDLESCPTFHNHITAEFEYAEVSYFERENDDCVCVGYEGVGTVGYSPLQQLRIKRRELVAREAGSTVEEYFAAVTPAS